MAIAKMTKVIIASHRTEASELLESLQGAGICHVLNAEEAAVSKELPERSRAVRQRDIEELLGRIESSVVFLGSYVKADKGLGAMLAPRKVMAEADYRGIVADESLLSAVDDCERVAEAIDGAGVECETLRVSLGELAPWKSLDMPVEELGGLEKADCIIGLVGAGYFELAEEKLAELGAGVEIVGAAGNRNACLVVCLKEQTDQVQKVLRALEFETASFAGMSGTVEQLMAERREKLKAAEQRIEQLQEQAYALSDNHLKLRVLSDHYSNLLGRENARESSPATEQTVLLEGWVKTENYGRLEDILSGFGASSLSKVEPGEDEDVPVEINNTVYVRPFESITRLYGMPVYDNLDPTIFLMPFFALFFGLCLTDAGYGLVMIGFIAYMIKKMQGDKGMMWMFLVCSVLTVGAGAMTGGWFGDAVQMFAPGLGGVRDKMMWFDPMINPMLFFKLSLGLGFFHLIVGIVIAMVHNLKKKDYMAAVCDNVTWLVMLNSLLLFGLAKAGILPPGVGKVFGMVALVPAIGIVGFSERGGGLGQRFGMGAYNLFSAVFYLGDILSYARLMALGMVTAGFAMATNVIVDMLVSIDIPIIGVVFGIIVFVLMHMLNLVLSALSAFVHTLRLQFVEFFPKFFVGGGREFEPLSKRFRHVYITRDN